MTKIDDNDLVEYTIYATIASYLGNSLNILTTLFYLGMFIVLGIFSVGTLLFSLGIL
jgi:hypothetical protein